MGSQLLSAGQQVLPALTGSCGQLANLAQGANGAVAAYSANCSSSIDSCRDDCKAAKEYLKSNLLCIIGGDSALQSTLESAASDSLERCNGFDAKMQAANQAVQSYVGAAAQGTQCAAEADAAATVPDYCKLNPTVPGCVAAAIYGLQ